MTTDMFQDPHPQGQPAAAARQIAARILSGPVELADDPDGQFHQVMYDLHMGGAPAPVEPGAERLVVRIRPTRTYTPPAYVA